MTTPLSRSISLEPTIESHQPDFSHDSTNPINPTASKSSRNHTSKPSSFESLSTSSSSKYRCHCGFEPTGEEKWKPSNLRRHKRTQHPVEQKIHACTYPGCTSTFTRSDNLTSHRKLKSHIVIKGDDFGSGNDAWDRKFMPRPRERVSKKRKIGGMSEMIER